MLRTSNKDVKKEAIDVFKQIQIYMGDRLARTSPTQAALEVVSSGWTNQDLRDEIFVQLCRQTTNNPKPSVMNTFTGCAPYMHSVQKNDTFCFYSRDTSWHNFLVVFFVFLFFLGVD